MRGGVLGDLLRLVPPDSFGVLVLEILHSSRYREIL